MSEMSYHFAGKTNRDDVMMIPLLFDKFHVGVYAEKKRRRKNVVRSNKDCNVAIGKYPFASTKTTSAFPT